MSYRFADGLRAGSGRNYNIIKQYFVMYNSVRLGNFTFKFFASCASGYQMKEYMMGREIEGDCKLIDI